MTKKLIIFLIHLNFSLLKDYESMAADAAADEERFVGNPLNSYLLIKRMTSDWKSLKEVISASPSQEFLQVEEKMILHCILVRNSRFPE